MKLYWFKKLIVLSVAVSLITACDVRNANITKGFLNSVYNLRRVGDLHGLSPTSNEVLDRNPGYTSYVNLFYLEGSYINFCCKGTSYDDFHCEASFKLTKSDGTVLVEKEGFLCTYNGWQNGNIYFDDKETEQYLGTIYVYTPYWCRWQYEFDIDGNGNNTLLTFEFWRGQYNPLPDFLNNENEQ